MTSEITSGRGLYWLIAAGILAIAPLAGGSAIAAEAVFPRYCLVGVGPGDPDLITLRALRAIRAADLVICSDGIAKKFTDVLEDKQVIRGYWRLFPYYGHDPSEYEGEQRRECEAITAERNKFISIVRKAVSGGKRVVMLDNGDPLVYGPCAWSLEEFADLNPVVVPGVSCFNAANAALRRGVTTSEHTKSVILTAADWPGKTDTIAKLATHGSTMALFTMRTEFGEFIDKLTASYPPDTPIAIVKQAGYADREEVIEATLGTIRSRIRPEDLPFEYMIYIGEFLTYRYNKQPVDAGANTAPTVAPPGQ